jgi:hypothetical protein
MPAQPSTIASAPHSAGALDRVLDEALCAGVRISTCCVRSSARSIWFRLEAATKSIAI